MDKKVYYRVEIENSPLDPLMLLVYAENIKEVYEILIYEYPNPIVLSVKLTDYDFVLRREK